MSTPTESVGNLEIAAMTKVLKRTILIFNENLSFYWFGEEFFSYDSLICIRFTNLSSSIGHYEAVLLTHDFHTFDINNTETFSSDVGKDNGKSTKNVHNITSSLDMNNSVDPSSTTSHLSLDHNISFNNNNCNLLNVSLGINKEKNNELNCSNQNSNLNNSGVINLSSNTNLSNSLFKLLGKGKGFCPTPHHFNKLNFIKDTLDYTRRLKLKERFYDDHLEPSNIPKNLYVKSKWNPPSKRNASLDLYCEVMEKEATRFIPKSQNPRNNLSKKERITLQQLSSDCQPYSRNSS